MNINKTVMWPGNTYLTEDGKPTWLTPTERDAYTRLLAQDADTYADMAQVLLFCGLQVRQLLALKVSDIADESLSVEGRDIPLPGLLSARLRKQAATGDFLFTCSRHTVTRNVKHQLQRAGVRESVCMPQTLRRTWLVTAYKACHDPVVFAKWSGLAFDSIQMVARAVTLVDGPTDEHAEALRLWEAFGVRND